MPERSVDVVVIGAGQAGYDPQPPFDSGAPAKADASTLRLAFRLLLGDRPLRMAAQVEGHAAPARFARARRALTRRRPTERAHR